MTIIIDNDVRLWSGTTQETTIDVWKYNISFLTCYSSLSNWYLEMCQMIGKSLLCVKTGGGKSVVILLITTILRGTHIVIILLLTLGGGHIRKSRNSKTRYI